MCATFRMSCSLKNKTGKRKKRLEEKCICQETLKMNQATKIYESYVGSDSSKLRKIWEWHLILRNCTFFQVWRYYSSYVLETVITNFSNLKKDNTSLGW